MAVRSNTRKKTSGGLCPVGQHYVRGHYRIVGSGKRTWVDAHCRNNRGRSEVLLEENLHYVFEKAFGPFKRLKAIHGFPAHNGVDAIIQFWLRYWKAQGLKFPNLDPLLIKAVIATESSFNSKAKARGSSATGLMQVTGQARRILAGKRRKGEKFSEMKPPYVDVTEMQLEDPNVAIASGIRWLIHKHYAVKKKPGNPIRNMLKAYYSWNADGDKYADKILKLYKKSKN